MCTRATCRHCGKATWRGCGAHIEQVLAGVPKDERCVCEVHAPAGVFSGLWKLLRGK